ncbi:hypothetical protein NLU13_7934 [Sarocladium strictum]|uniref:Aminotransferase class I/classII large domain-containing protein n=1 Tax=Sarocladium strictum TaxID=5046 RepID=A0AA39L607_SARSR|nr:hypothetical protein NLU13_7934 [Sarocladium strictum]
MQAIPTFALDNWIRDTVPKCTIRLDGSCASYQSLDDLRKLAPDSSQDPVNSSLALDYGETSGLRSLRERIAYLHSTDRVKVTAEDVIITSGSIAANYLALSTLLGPKDHVICQYPTYGQLITLPRHLGAEVSLWEAEVENNWEPDVKELARLIKPNTKAIIINNPCNPTGAVLRQPVLDAILKIVQEKSLLLLSDEVFRPLFHNSTREQPSSAVSLGYRKVLCTGSLSKAYGLPGIRVGWVVSPDPEIISRMLTVRDYTTITVSQLDQGVASFALSPAVLPRLLEKNLSQCGKGIALIDHFIKENDRWCSWVPPAGTGVAFILIRDDTGRPVDAVDFCTDFADKRGICLIPAGYSFSDQGRSDFEGYIRLGISYCPELEQALQELSTFLQIYMQAL